MGLLRVFPLHTIFQYRRYLTLACLSPIWRISMWQTGIRRARHYNLEQFFRPVNVIVFTDQSKCRSLSALNSLYTTGIKVWRLFFRNNFLLAHYPLIIIRRTLQLSPYTLIIIARKDWSAGLVADRGIMRCKAQSEVDECFRDDRQQFAQLLQGCFLEGAISATGPVELQQIMLFARASNWKNCKRPNKVAIKLHD